MKEMVNGTRVFGRLTPETYSDMITPFLENSQIFGSCLVVSQKQYEHLNELAEFVKDKADLRLSDTKGNESPADMCNQILNYCAENNLDYFGIVSGDLSKNITKVMPRMLDRLKSNPDLTTIGLAIEGVHNTELLQKIKEHGRQELNVDNYATIFHNNAFSVHRLIVPGVPLEQRLFPRESDQKRLGVLQIDGREVPVGGNEEIALVMKLISLKVYPKVELLAFEHIARDTRQEVKSLNEKISRRPLVARRYQEHFRVTDEQINDYLNSSYNIRYDI